jgi:hypothetical protein
MGIGIREYAKRRGCHHSSVQEAIDSGRIHKLADGTIDPVTADREWSANTGTIKSGGDRFREAATKKMTIESGLKQIDLHKKMGKLVEMKIVQSEWFAIQRDLMEHFMPLGRDIMPVLLDEGKLDLAKGARIIDGIVIGHTKEYENGWENRILKLADSVLHAQDGEECDLS